MPQEIKNHIEKVGDKWRLLSHEGKNLGTFDTEEEAKKHEGDVEYFKEHTNATQTQKPSVFYCRHMQPGTCAYEKETILVDTDCLQNMLKSGVGIPVYVHHQVRIDIRDQRDKADGYVTESFYNELDGWAWFKMLVITDEARLAIANGWKVSNAYRPLVFGPSGKKNNVPYDREFKEAELTHLAIVPNPRYEKADIFTPDEFKTYQESLKQKLTELHNSKAEKPLLSKGIAMFKFLRKKTEEVQNAGDATHVEIDGKIVSVAEMVNAVKKNESESDAEAKREAEEKKKAEEKENEMVDVQGEKMPLKELVNRYTKMNEKRNADEEEKKKKEEEEKKNAEDKAKAEKEAEEKKNAEEAPAKKKEEDEKTNGKDFFEMVMNAHQSAPEGAVISIETGGSMTARGAQRYGSGK